MLHFCLIFFSNLLNNPIALIVRPLANDFAEMPGMKNGQKKYKPMSRLVFMNEKIMIDQTRSAINEVTSCKERLK